MVRTKVFVGNLAFTTKEPELAAAFQGAGKVIGANIITRGPRSLGYGFVEMDSEEDANKAVELMNKKELNGRQINVEVAKPRDETKEKTQEEGAEKAQRKRRGPRRRPEGEKKEAAPRPAATSENKGEETEEGEKRRRRRGPRAKKPAPEAVSREESKTTLFVANLPFSLDDESFAKTVSELGLKPKAAHVVKKRNGRSKGYGFVEFENDEDQKKALEGLNGKTVEGRELSVKIALTEQPPKEGEAPATQPTQPVEKKTAAPAEKKAAAPAEKKAASPAEKKAAPAEKKAAAPASEKKTAAPEKKTESPAKSSEKK
jgi:RNA recognition motif-containing protein